MKLVRLICEQPTPTNQDGEPVVFDVSPREVSAKLAQLKALGWKTITQVDLTNINDSHD
jgi:hypothetical protein